jgi:feruloyl esterase
MRRFATVLLIAGAASALGAVDARAASCESLVDLALPDTTILSATPVPAGPLAAVGVVPGDSLLQTPAFCRVVGVTTPAVRFEVWLPLDGWNRKLQVAGNDRMGGAISYGALAGAIGRGYAAASTDTGHGAPRPDTFDAQWALGRPELVVDFGHRAVHVTAVNAKQIVRAFYERAPEHAYFVGCSKGGQQALMAAQRYPDDFDGIVAGAPTHDYTRFYAGAHLWYAIATLKDEGSYIPPDKLPILDRAVVATCDALDGVADGLLSDPRECRFDPGTLVCRPDQDPASCLTAGQATAVADIWRGARTSSGAVVFPGLVPGAESTPNGWNPWVTGSAGPFTSTHWYAADSFFKYLVFEDAAWDFRAFDYDVDVERALARVGGALDANDPNLRPFKALGGKLLVYHGWSDADVTPLSSIDYYERVLPVIGGATRDQALRETQDFFRLFLAPGMAHCGGGPGPDRFDPLSALERWVETGVPPDRITASHQTDGVTDRTRPLCPYPQVAVWDGVGSIDDAASFSCRAAAGPPPR